MATLSYADILKRDNVSVLIGRIENKGAFNLGEQKGETVTCTGKYRFTINSKVTSLELKEENLRYFLQNKSNPDKLEIEVKKGNTKVYTPLTKMFKDKEFGGTAGKSSGQGSERQEIGLLNLINENCVKSDNMFIASFGRDKKLLKAEKKTGQNKLGKEPYIDIIIHTRDGKQYGVSMKGETAPSLAGGGLAGINAVAPDLLKKVYDAVAEKLVAMGLSQGMEVNAEMIPDFFIKIPDNYVKLILVGNEDLGGPIDYMYIGKMNVTGTVTNNEIKPNGTFYSIDEYMAKIPDFYFRIRKRDLEPSGNIRIEFTKKNSEGYPLIFSSARYGKNNLRLVITDKVPTTGIKLTIT